MDPTKTKLLRKEYVKALRKLSESAKREILEVLGTTDAINEATIGEIKQIVSKHLAGDKAEEVVAYYTQQFWQRGADFANRQLKRYGITIEIPPHLGILDNETLLQLENLQLDLIKGLSEETKKALAFQLREGIIRGESISELTKRVKEVINDTKWKAERIARTESTRVFNAAAIDRYQKAGLKKWKWYAAADERTCPICGAKHDKIFNIGDPTPPAHPNCRCTTLPYFDKESEEERKEEFGVGIPEIDEKIGKALDDFEKALKEEGSFTKAVNRVVNGRPLSVIESERIGKEIYKSYMKGASKDLRERIQLLLPTKVNRRLIEKAGNVQINYQKSGNPHYNWWKKRITLIRGVGSENEWRDFLHEYGHHLEHYGAEDVVKEFYLARIRKRGYKLRRLNEFKNYEFVGYDVYIFEGFEHISPYMGRFYPSKLAKDSVRNLMRIKENPEVIEDLKGDIMTEFVSVGLEHFATEESMKKLYEADREVFAFLLSVLRGDFI
ncbi:MULTISPECIES: minor capsid protein [unclassified Archaeoglobus]|jgi:SPP1 gp7 family putative phage head morphogenesis protein|uniref:minor capsid protein n=1 Tax=unclassified Archaeoglobus TaxID=2643606 RepID=UPI0025C72E18|nr:MULTISPECIES: minor capsid protein [unclassified Archaeoglobus]